MHFDGALWSHVMSWRQCGEAVDPAIIVESSRLEVDGGCEREVSEGEVGIGGVVDGSGRRSLVSPVTVSRAGRSFPSGNLVGPWAGAPAPARPMASTSHKNLSPRSCTPSRAWPLDAFLPFVVVAENAEQERSLRSRLGEPGSPAILDRLGIPRRSALEPS